MLRGGEDVRRARPPNQKAGTQQRTSNQNRLLEEGQKGEGLTSTAPWIPAETRDKIAMARGCFPAEKVAKVYDVSPRTVYRVWSRVDSDCRYHSWCIVSDPSDRAMLRVAYTAESFPDGIVTPEDVARLKILRAIRALGPEAVASLIPSDPPQAS